MHVLLVMFGQEVHVQSKNLFDVSELPPPQYMPRVVWPILSWPDHARLIGAISAKIDVDRMDSVKSVISSRVYLNEV